MQTLQIADRDVQSITESVWTSILGLELKGNAASAVFEGPGNIAHIQIAGAWSGVITLQVSDALAKTCAKTMFALDSVTTEEVRDALGEIVNIIGGKLKCALPGPSRLGLPGVCRNNGDMNWRRHLVPVCTLSLASGGEAVLFQILQSCV
ncbi:MAG: chemotaxis protein CheX [Planctomycetes bacterium]|nr:chemotaxis protein CheX [Planctomycetota bacterium]